MGDFRIAICGASGTGKTKIITEVNKHFGLEFNPVGSRSVAARMGYDNPYDVDKDGRREEFQYLLMSDKIDWERSNNNFISDRTTFDVLTYTVLHDINAVNEQFVKMAIKGWDRYTHVFFFSIEEFHNVGDDPVRIKSKTYHEIYEATMIGLIDRYTKNSKIIPVRINGDQVKGRTDLILDILNNS